MHNPKLPVRGALLALSLMTFATPQLHAAEPLTIDDLFRLGAVSDPRLSPEGGWIAYTVERADLEEDEARSRIWMTPAAGGEAAQALTAADQSSSHPRWSPDGRYLAFLSARDDKPAQVWRLARNGGEAERLTNGPQEVKAFEWSPDSGRLLLLLQDPTDAEVDAYEQGELYQEQTPPPKVIDRQQFKEDYIGYLDRRRTHLYVLDLASGRLTQLTHGDFDDSEPAWSPDGRRIAFTSNRSDDPDANYNTDLWVVDADPARAPAEPQRVTANPGPDEAAAWSPDGRCLAHRSATDVAAMVYATVHLAVSCLDGESRVLTAALDRNVLQPEWAPDGRHIWFLLEDSGEQALARIRPAGGEIERRIRGESVVSQYHVGRGGEIAALVSRPQLPPEVFLLDGRRLEQRSFTNREVLAGLQLGEVVEVSFKSPDGTPIEGFVVKPPGFVEGRRYPAILDIHGGPQAQYDFSFNFEAQLYAAQGYLAILPNPRGSTGYGQAFCLAIWRDWGGPDYEDVMAAVDDAITRGWADPERLGVGGWSYGGILTNHVITKTDRFDAAISGASEVLYVVNYGHDHYQRWWEQELGLPWEPEARAIYERMSPFNRVQQVKTPTLVMGGEEDWNVPIINSEQLYLALKRLGVDTQLVVYPGEYHGIAKPSYQRDLYRRYLEWYGRYLQ